MTSLARFIAANASITKANFPKTAVFVGATDGIGKATLTNLVSKGFPIKAYIVGRDEARHRAQLDELRKLNPQADLVYVEGQISLVAESKRLADQIAAQEERLDLLYLSAGYLPFAGRQETSEGLEASEVVSYYSHIIFVTRLITQLRAAAKLSDSARVVNILAAGQESIELFLDDLTLKGPDRFNVPNFACHVATMMTLSLKRLAEEPENKDIIFIHAHPGRVSTNLVAKSWGNKLDPSQAPVAPRPGNLTSFTPEEAGERAVYLITSAEYGGKGTPVPEGRQAGQTLAHGSKGSLFNVNDKMEVLQQDQILEELEGIGAPQKIWDHTAKLIGFST